MRRTISGVSGKHARVKIVNENFELFFNKVSDLIRGSLVYWVSVIFKHWITGLMSCMSGHVLKNQLFHSWSFCDDRLATD